MIGKIGPFLLVRETPKPLQASVHVSAVNESDSAAIIKNEQTGEFQGQDSIEDGLVGNNLQMYQLYINVNDVPD